MTELGIIGPIMSMAHWCAQSTIIISMGNPTSGGRFPTMSLTLYKKTLILKAFQMSFAHTEIG
jgi:hypothetical protein